MINANLQLFSTNKQTKLPKIFTTTLALILSLILSFTPNSCFASAITNTGSTNASFFNNTAAVVATTAVGLGIGGALIAGLLSSSNKDNNNSAPVTLTSITITPHAPSIASSTTQPFHATGTYSDGTTQDLTKSVTWSSSHTSVATISNSHGSHGLVTALPNDTLESVTTEIKATLSGITSPGVTLTVTVALNSEDDSATYDSATATYTVTYDANSSQGGIGGSYTDPQKYTVNAFALQYVSAFTHAGTTGDYFIIGWNTQADLLGTYYPIGSTFPISANTTLYAKWIHLIDEFDEPE